LQRAATEAEFVGRPRGWTNDARFP